VYSAHQLDLLLLLPVVLCDCDNVLLYKLVKRSQKPLDILISQLIHAAAAAAAAAARCVV
jgi:hypothetical protein